MESDETNSSEGLKQEREIETVEGSDEGKGEITDPGNSVDGEDSQLLSKRQRKKFLRRQKWLNTKQERKKREKEKLRHRLEAKRAAGEPCGNIRKRLKEVTMAASRCKQRIAIDMSFDDLMIEKHLSQCVKQISRCYSANRRVTDPMQLYVTSFKGKCEAVMAKQDGYLKWDVYFKPEYYMDIFPKEEVVYLTSESENMITSLDDTKVYVIGGLVDHNVHKGLCYKLATEKGIKHAKLPLDDFIDMKTRKVLTVDHVYQILLGIVKGESWKESLLSIIPARKGATGKDDDENYINAEECDEGNDTKVEKNLENETTKSVEVLGKNNENS